MTYITKIFNRSLQFNYFPKEWKHAQITVLPKPKKDTKFAENYRPISLLSCLGKIYEKIILTRIIDHCDRNYIIPDFQHGFKNKLLIYMQILRPTLIYACPIWGHAAHSNIKQIEIAQNLILRTITKADWYIRNEDIRSALNIKTLKEVIRKIATKFFINIDAHDNRAILRIEKYPINPLFNRPRNDEN
ncbi:hypothetical protein TNCV_86441 [Trichonephila clavipes]|nr:hypothetical protein TNCV_86441 [Trichonephila clavipes]